VSSGVWIAAGALVAEIVLLALVFLSVAYVRQRAAQRRDREALVRLVGRVREQRTEREAVLDRFVADGLGIDGEQAADFRHRLLREESALIQRFIDIYRARESALASRFDGDVFALLDAYHAIQPLSPPDTGDTGDTDDTGDMGEAVASDQADELARLREENARLEGELRITMETMSRMLNDYSSMFAADREKSDAFPPRFEVDPADGDPGVSDPAPAPLDGEIHEIDDSGADYAAHPSSATVADDVDAEGDRPQDVPGARAPDSADLLLDETDATDAATDPLFDLPGTEAEAADADWPVDAATAGDDWAGLSDDGTGGGAPNSVSVEEPLSIEEPVDIEEPLPGGMQAKPDIEEPFAEAFPQSADPEHADLGSPDADAASPLFDEEDPIEQILREARSQEEAARERELALIPGDAGPGWPDGPVPSAGAGDDRPVARRTAEAFDWPDDIALDDLFDETDQGRQRQEG
jgi:hypothetical protein